MENYLELFFEFIKSIYWKEIKFDFGFNFLKRVIFIGMSIYAYWNGLKLTFFLINYIFELFISKNVKWPNNNNNNNNIFSFSFSSFNWQKLV
jgi:hypothetical protein